MKEKGKFFCVGAFALAVLLGATDLATAREAIKIGVAAAQTGPGATFGIATRRGAEIAVEEINAKGGIKGRKLELIVRDDEHNPVKTVPLKRELVEREKVVALLGASNSASMLAVAPIINDELKVPIIAPGTEATKIVENDAWEKGRDNYVFRYGMFGRGQANFLVDMAIKRFGYKRPAVVTWTGGWGVTGRGELNRRLGEIGIKPVVDLTYDTGDTDMTPQLLRVRENKADMMLNYGIVRDNVFMVRSRDKIGDKTPYFSAWGIASPAFWRAAGELAEGVVVSTTVTSDGPQSPERMEFLKKHYVRYGREMEVVWGTFAAYDIVHLLTLVIDRVGTDPKAIREGLENVSYFKGLVKEFKRPVFTRTRHDALMEEDFILCRFTDGKQLQIYYDAEGPFVILDDGAKRYIDRATLALK